MNARDRTKAVLGDVFAHDFAEKARLGRAAAAVGYGLDPEKYASPFPTSQTTIHVQEAGGNGGGLMKAAALAAAVGLGAGGIGYFLANRSEPPAVSPPTAPAPPAVPPQVQSEDLELRIKWWIEDENQNRREEPDDARVDEGVEAPELFEARPERGQ